MQTGVNQNEAPLVCRTCGHEGGSPGQGELGVVKGNTERFRSVDFRVWKCPSCQTIQSVDPVNFEDIYRDDPLLRRTLDWFARRTSQNLLRRLKRAGLKPSHRILDYGCGPGVFLQFLREKGYSAWGYDPYAPGHTDRPVAEAPFDCIVLNDTIEHCEDVRGVIQSCVELLSPGGILYVGTADSAPVDMEHLEREVMRLHQPFHRIIFTAETLRSLVTEAGLEIVQAYRRSYHDTLWPGVNYRALDEANSKLGHSFDRMLDPKQIARAVTHSPRLWFFFLFGYLFPSADEPAVICRK